MREKGAPPDARIARLAARQHGVVSIKQLREAGLSDAAVSRRVAGGHLHRIHRGVYAVGHRRVGIEGLWMAAVTRAEDFLRTWQDELPFGRPLA